MSGKLAAQHPQRRALRLAPEIERVWVRELRPSASRSAEKVPQQRFYLICTHCSFQIKTSLFIIINNWRVGKYSLRQEAALEVQRRNGSCSAQQNQSLLEAYSCSWCKSHFSTK